VTPTFTLKCHWNEYLPRRGDRLDVIFSIESRGTGLAYATNKGSGGEVIVLDVSGSMEGAKLTQARTATISAIQCVQEGVPFAVVAGNESARQVYPASGMVPAVAKTRAEAARAIGRLKAGGGTAIGGWITLATQLLATTPGIRHAILLTDGRDEHESPEALSAALDAAAGVFQCDCRGVGTDWEVEELRQVSTALLGSLDIVADPANLASDFRDMVLRAMERAVKNLQIRVWTPEGGDVLLLKQVAPDILPIAGSNLRAAEHTRCFSTGSWADESRDYHLALGVPPGAVGERVLAARVSVLADGRVIAESPVRATWTDDEILTSRINRHVAHFTGQQDLADAIQDGLSARRAGDRDTATVKFGLAARLSATSGHSATASLLEKLVDVEDWESGTVHLKPYVAVADEMALDTRSTRTVRSLS
jgi:hypothetical protein